MLRKNWFYIALIIIYVVFLMKDNIIGLVDNKKDITTSISNLVEEDALKENQELHGILELKEMDTKIVYSKILSRNMDEFFDQMTITKGLNDNIKKGDAVISEKGLIGIVSNSFKNYSEVSLITNANTNISVKINDAYGMLYAHDNKLYVKNIKLGSDIKVGDKITSSGLTNIKEGIYIGTVKSITKDAKELEYIMEVENAIAINHIKYVGVLTND